MIASIVLTFDHLPLSLLGCYGASWIDTPGFDRLSAEGLTWDRLLTSEGRWLIDGPAAQSPWELRGADLLTRWVQHAAVVGESVAGGGGPQPVLHVVATAERLAMLPPSLDFERHVVAAGEEIDGNVNLLRRGAELVAELRDQSQPAWLWIAAEGLPTSGLPPIEVHDLYLDELVNGAELLEWLESLAAGGSAAGESSDPAAELWQQVWHRLAEGGSFAINRRPRSPLESKIKRAFAAASTSLIDRELEVFLNEIAGGQTVAAPRLLVAGLAGGLMMHRHASDGLPALGDEALQTPAWLWTVDDARSGVRDRRMLDLESLLAAWLPESSQRSQQSGAEAGGAVLAESAAAGEESRFLTRCRDAQNRPLFSLRTGEWRLIGTGIEVGSEGGPNTGDPIIVTSASGPAADSRVWLFRKPQDAWEVDDLASRELVVVEELLASLHDEAR
ncbi:MAG: hypothetical protein R3B90_18630 [Planctomycetaceae bacterium]